MDSKIVSGIQIRLIPGSSIDWISSHGYLWRDAYITKHNHSKKGKWVAIGNKNKPRRQINVHYSDVIKYEVLARLVALCWIGPPPFEDAFVRHLNDDEYDNCCLNLTYGTQIDNMEDRLRNRDGHYEGSTKLTKEQVIDAYISYHEKMETIRSIGARLGVSYGPILSIANGHTWGHVTSLLNVKKRTSHPMSSAKVTEEMAREIKKLLSEGRSGLSIARQFGLHHSTVSYIKNGLTWSHLV